MRMVGQFFRNRIRRSSNSAFTLIELAIAIAVIAIIAMITTVYYSSSQGSARDADRIQDLNHIARLMSIYAADKDPISTGSGCGSGGNGNGWFGYSDGSSYPKSVMSCLIDAGLTNEVIVDPTGAVTCGGATCQKNHTYMVYTCTQSGQLVTYLYANMDIDSNKMSLAGTCNSGAGTYGMNYWIKFTYQ